MPLAGMRNDAVTLAGAVVSGGDRGAGGQRLEGEVAEPQGEVLEDRVHDLDPPGLDIGDGGGAALLERRRGEHVVDGSRAGEGGCDGRVGGDGLGDQGEADGVVALPEEVAAELPAL